MKTYIVPFSLATLFVLEILALTFAFDTQGLLAVHTFWARLVGWSPQSLRLVSSITVATLALVALGRQRVLPILRLERDAATRTTAGAVHVFSLALFAWVTSMIVRVGASYQIHPALWTLAWLVSGVVTFSAWALLLLPVRGWGALLAQTHSSIVAGAVIGAIGWAFGFVTEEFWIPVAQYTFGAVTWMLRFLYPRTVSVPARLVVGTPSFRVQITPQCSGYEGVGLLLAFLTAYLWFYRKELRFPAALILLPLGAAVAWLANTVRIVALIAIGTAGWRGIATGGFHSQAGWIAFNLIALCFVALTNQTAYFRRRTLSTAHALAAPASPDADQTAAYLGPFIVITATAMITGLFSAGFDWLYPIRLVTVGAFLWVFRKQYLALRWSWSWWSLAIGFVAFLVWIALVPSTPDRSGGWPGMLRAWPVGWAAAWFLFRSIGYVVMTPLAEELAFRGFLTRRLARADFSHLPVTALSWWALGISSLVFGVLHGTRWLPATLAGMSFGLALYRRGAIGEAVWAHATTNGLIALYACATGRWSVWS